MSDDVLETMLEIATGAASIARDVYATSFSVDYKSPGDPVTEADRRANAFICKGLADRFGDVPVVAEESDPRAYERFRAAPRVFFVDPVDGTAEFVKKNDEFAVMIGLLEEERPVAAVIYAPVPRTGWIGRVGAGAWQVDDKGEREPIRVSPTSDLADAMLVLSRSHRTEHVEKALSILGAARHAALGSAGLKGAEIARGAADAYVSPGTSGCRWDACASDALVTAAGGSFTDAFGDPIAYRAETLRNDRGVVATNGRLHGAVLDRLASYRATLKE